MAPPLIALLTDFGTQDWYAAAVQGVLLTRLPRTRVVTVTHEIPPGDIAAGALTLAAAMPWFPRGTVFLAVIDPGVGSARALLAARAGGYTFVGPDNGVLALALRGAGVATIVRLARRRFWARTISRTFHGRDIMAPVAAFLAGGGALERLGPRVSQIRPAPWPAVQRRGGHVRGRIVHIDRFGNLITNLMAADLRGAAGKQSMPVVQFRRRDVRVVSSYADGHAGELIALVGSQGWIELAVREQSAAARYAARRGQVVTIARRPRRPIRPD